MSPALPHRGVRSVTRATPRPSPTPQGLPGHVGRTYLVPPAAAASQLLLMCLKSQREGRHDPGTSSLWVGAKSGGRSRMVTPLTPALSGDTVRPGAGGVSQEAMSSRMHPLPLQGSTPAKRRPPPAAHSLGVGGVLPRCRRLAPGLGGTAGLAPPHPITSAPLRLSSHLLEMG